MTLSNEYFAHKAKGTNNALGSRDGQIPAQSTQSCDNQLTNAQRSSQHQESPHHERSQVNNLPGWRSNLEVFASAETSTATSDSATLGGHELVAAQGEEQSMRASVEPRRRNATCDRLLGQQLHAWRSDNHEDGDVAETRDASGARDSLPEAPGQAERASLQPGETETNDISQGKRNAGEVKANDEDEEEPDSIGAFLNDTGARKRGRHH